MTEYQFSRHPESLIQRVDPMLEANRAREVADLRQIGYTGGITILDGLAPDPAFDSPDEVVRIAEMLAGYDRELKRRHFISQAGERAVRGLSIAFPAITKLTGSLGKYWDRRQEPVRHKLLFGPTQGEPWHNARGKAIALNTIVEAHELKSTRYPGGKYETMSGHLGDSFGKFVFPDNTSMGMLAGMSLEESIIHTGQEFRHKTGGEASAYATKELEKLREFLKARPTDEFADVVRYCIDSIGIRNRKVLVTDRIMDKVERWDNSTDMSERVLMSLGCGTATTMFDVMQQCIEKHSACPKVVLVDQDPIALAAAYEHAKQLGLEDRVEIICEPLFDDKGVPLDLQRVFGDRKIDISEDSGLREYLSNSVYVALTQKIVEVMKPGGRIVTSNMRSKRPQREFLHGMMGWKPSVIMRSATECMKLHQRAGLPLIKTDIFSSLDGVYNTYVTDIE